MKQQSTAQTSISAAEIQLVEQLRQHPELLERIQSIVALTRNAEGPLKSADEVEALLIEELRALGNTSMNQWARVAEQRVSEELKLRDATVRSRKKKS